MPHRCRPLAMVTALCAVLMLAGCGSGSSSSGQEAGKGKVGIALPGTEQARWAGDGLNMNEQLTLLGYSTMIRNAEDDASTQVEQVNEMIRANVKALIVAAVDSEALTPTLERASKQKIPIIAFDRLIMNSKHVDYYTTFDNSKVGELQGQFLVDHLKLKKAKGPFTIELFSGSPDDNNAKYFFNGAMRILQPYIKSGKLVVRSGETAFTKTVTLKWDSQTAKSRMSELMAKYYSSTKIDAVLSPNDNIARGILAALKKVGYGTSSQPYPTITGQDAELASIKLIASGDQSQTVLKDSREEAKATVRMVDQILQGKKPEINNTTDYNNGAKIVPTFLLDPVSVTQDNYKTKIIKSGVYTEEELLN